MSPFYNDNTKKFPDKTGSKEQTNISSIGCVMVDQD